jgi:hypothetical protein
MALLGEEYAPLGLQATVLGLANSCQQLGSLAATLIWSSIIHAAGLRRAFTAAAALFGLAATPLLVPCARFAAWRLVACHRCLHRRHATRSLLGKTVQRSDEHELSAGAAKAAAELERPCASTTRTQDLVSPQ